MRNARAASHLAGKRAGMINPMKATFVRLGTRGFNPKLRNALDHPAALRAQEDSRIPPDTMAKLQREMLRLAFHDPQIKQIEDARQ